MTNSALLLTTHHHKLYMSQIDYGRGLHQLTEQPNPVKI